MFFTYTWNPSPNQKEMDGTKPSPNHFQKLKDFKLAYWVPTICFWLGLGFTYRKKTVFSYWFSPGV